jgi:hypothetical protein
MDRLSKIPVGFHEVRGREVKKDLQAPENLEELVASLSDEEAERALKAARAAKVIQNGYTLPIPERDDARGQEYSY